MNYFGTQTNSLFWEFIRQNVEFPVNMLETEGAENTIDFFCSSKLMHQIDGVDLMFVQGPIDYDFRVTSNMNGHNTIMDGKKEEPPQSQQLQASVWSIPHVHNEFERLRTSHQ